MNDLTTEEQLIASDLGEPGIHDVAVNPASFWTRTTRNRDAEVCMVVKRPSGKLLVFRKTFYPPGVMRLLTGGVEPGEPILAALRREVMEETGLDVHVARYLTLIRYRADDDSETMRFRTHAFLLEERGGILGALDEHEQVESFGEIDIEELPGLAARLEELSDRYSSDLDQRWSLWGDFRAVAPRVIFTALHDQP